MKGLCVISKNTLDMLDIPKPELEDFDALVMEYLLMLNRLAFLNNYFNYMTERY